MQGVAGQGGGAPGAAYFWGENLAGAARTPVRLEKQDRLVYAPHTFGPGGGDEDKPYFRTNDFPYNMPKVWHSHFLDAREATGVPVVVGEAGGSFEGADKLWQQAFMRWATQNAVGVWSTA